MSEQLPDGLQLVCDRIEYSPETGRMKWKSTIGRAKEGFDAGTINRSGYIRIQTRVFSIMAHRLAWFIYYGKLPGDEIDHINGIKSDNRISNLREATRSLNNQNLVKSRSKGILGINIPGVHFHKKTGKFQVSGTVNGKRVYIGLFGNLKDAEQASLEFRRANYEGNTL